MAKEEVAGIGDIVPGLIVRHTSRRLGDMDRYEACERLVSGRISFSEFVDQVGDGYRELLEFMTEHDLHPGRPADVLYCIECYAGAPGRHGLLAQMRSHYERGRQSLEAG